LRAELVPHLHHTPRPRFFSFVAGLKNQSNPVSQPKQDVEKIKEQEEGMQ
jgi:hypothetical protein